MKKFSLFAATLIMAVSMNLHAADVPYNIQVMELLGKMTQLQDAPMPNSCTEALVKSLNEIQSAKDAAEGGQDVDWAKLYESAKSTQQKCEQGIKAYIKYENALEEAQAKLDAITILSPYSAGVDELKAQIETLSENYLNGTLEADDKTKQLFNEMESVKFMDKASLSRKLVGTELRDMKSVNSANEVTMEFANGSGVTLNAKASSGCYVNGTKVTAYNYFTPGKYQSLDEAKTNDVWVGGKLTIGEGCSMTIDAIKVHLGSSTDGYIWDLYLNNAKDSTLYCTKGAYKISNCSKATHTNDVLTLSDSALVKLGALPAGDYEVRIYLYGKKNNDILLKELSVNGNVINGTVHVAPEVNMPDSLSALTATAEANMSFNMYCQYKANLEEAIEMAKTDTAYAANYAYLNTANMVAETSIEEYAALYEEIAIAKDKLEQGGKGHAGYQDFENAIKTAEDVYDNGSAKDAVSTKNTLIVAENAFYAAGASESAPVDVTAFIKNADFSDSTDCWTISGDSANVKWAIAEAENGFAGKYVKAESAKKFANYTIEQTITNIPNGDYKFTAKAYAIEGTNYGKGTLMLYANDKYATYGKSSSEGGVNASVYVRVTDGTLTLKFFHKDNRNNVVGFGEPKLEYYNFRSWANIKESESSYTVTINSQESMDDAFLKTDWAVGKDVTFSFATGTYDLGVNVGRNFPKTGADFNIVAASGAKPVLSGSLRSNGMKLNNYKVEGITFHNYTGSTSTDLSPLHFAKGQKDSVMNEVIVRNCQFDSLPASLIRLNAGNDTEKYIHSIIVENNVIDGIGHHFFQFAGGKAFGLANFTFRENIVKNMYATGGQLFNTTVSTKHPASDSIYTMTVEHNAFYKIGGSATAARNFLECNKDNDWAKVCINFNNNIFYDQYEWDFTKYSESNVAMFNKKEGQTVELNFLKNVVAPADAYTNFALDEPLDVQPFPVTSGNIAANYDLIIRDTATWIYTTDMKMLKSDSLYTAGVGGTYVGPASNYYGFDMEGDAFVVENLAQFDEVFAYEPKPTDLTILFKDNTDECGYYALGMDARKFPQNFGNVTFKAFDGTEPKISGSFRSSNGMKVNNYTVENLNFVEGNMNGKTDASPLYFHKGVKDSVMNEVVIRNCTFTDMPACMIRLNASNDNKYIHSIIVENNVVDGIAHHFFQFASGQNFGLANFTFRENIVKNMYATGGQFFNAHLSKNHPASDSVYTMTVEHNTFYKIGGCATAARKFLECSTANDWAEVYIDINNNIFYDQYDWDVTKYSESDVTLFTKGDNQTVEVNFLKNVVAPEGAYTNFSLNEPWDTQSFPLNPVGDILPEYDLIIADTADFWFDAENLLLGTNSKYYTGGVGDTYIGAKASYIYAPNIPENASYFWEATASKVYEQGGKAVAIGDVSRVNYRNAYTCYGEVVEKYTICLCGKKDLADGKYVELTLDQPLTSGDTIVITAHRNKSGSDPKSKARFYYDEGASFDDGTDGYGYNNVMVDSIAGPNTQRVIVPAAAEGKSVLKLTRGETGTNLFISQLMILKAATSNAHAVDGLDAASCINAVFANEGVIYINLSEDATVNVYDMTGRALKSINATNGLNAIEGLNAGQIYIVRANDTIAKIAL